MGRGYHIPGIISLLCALILLCLAAVSVPSLAGLDVARVKISSGSPTVDSDTRAVKEIRFGAWGNCWYTTTGTHACTPAGNPYNTTIFGPDRKNSVTIEGSCTQGLILPPIAAAATAIALALSFTTYSGFTLIATSLAAVLAIAAFGMDMVLFAWVRHQMPLLDGVVSSTAIAPGLWVTVVAFLLICFAFGTVCLGRKRDRKLGVFSWRDRYFDLPRSKYLIRHDG
ncbi:hypothetical protein C8Q77DRAFT_851065 [Trametes polyzona]|nr:hypothetical protein C8Q77DRAFT_851065 [Trametes polyzona]